MSQPRKVPYEKTAVEDKERYAKAMSEYKAAAKDEPEDEDSDDEEEAESGSDSD